MSNYQHVNPELQPTYDAVVSKLQNDTQFLDFADCLLHLNEKCYHTVYKLVQCYNGRSVDTDVDEESDEDLKYAAKF